MRTTPTLPLFLLVGLIAAQDPAAGAGRLQFADLRKPLSWTGTADVVRWTPEGDHVEVTKGKSTMWVEAATGKQVEPKAQPAANAANGGPGARGPGRGRRGAASPRAVVENGNLYVLAPGQRQPNADDKAIATVEGKVEELHVAPEAAAVSFVRGGNLAIVDAATGQEWQVTRDGSGELLHGMLDWVYQEEIYGRGDFQGHWWSPDAKMVAFLTLDESAVREFTVVDHVPQGFLDKERSVVAEVTNYPKVGDPNPTARLSVAHRDGKQVTAIDLSKYAKDVLVVRVEWTGDSKTLLVTLQDRIQTWAELCAVEPATGKLTTWIREESPTWVNRPESPRWLPDGSFLWFSERTGYNHIYHYGQGGKLIAAVTSGEWQVRGIEHVDVAAGQVWFEGTRDGAVDRNVYRAGLDGKSLHRLTSDPGSHTIEWNKGRTHFLDRWSAMDRPPTVRLCDADGKVIHELSSMPLIDNGYPMAARQRVSIPARDGYQLDGSVMLPVGFDPAKKHPVFLPTYSGPDSSSVRDSWGVNPWTQFLCHQGFIVMQVNVRSASNRGHAHTGTCYRQLGVQELKDLEDAVDWVCKNHAGDPARVGIQGWSYGGFMAAYALTHSKKFALGLAGAGVYDWRLYDTIYTERYMRLPDENAEGYDATSVIKAAKNLHGHLVIVHGSMDDNVHLQNAMQLLWALQTANKQNFELMIYPRSRHGLSQQVGQHQREFEWKRLKMLLDPAFKAE